MAATELEVKEISELGDVTITDDALALAYNETDGVGKASFANIKKYLGAEINIEKTAESTANGGTNTIKATTRNGTATAELSFNILNGQGINTITQTESTDANGLRSNKIDITASEAANSVSATIKDGVGVKDHVVATSTDENGLRSNQLDITYTDATEDSITVKDGVGAKTHSVTENTDDNGLRSNQVDVTFTDATSDTFTVKDGVGVKSAEQTTSSTLSGELNEYTIKLTNGTSSKIQVYNGRAGKDFRISKTYSSITEMENDFSGTDVDTYEFAMIDTGSVEDVDTGKLYCKGESAWSYIGDLSGAQGIKGDTGNGIASVTNETNSDGNVDITFTMTDGTSKTITVLNGTNVIAGDNISISDDYTISVRVLGTTTDNAVVVTDSNGKLKTVELTDSDFDTIFTEE